MTRDDTVYLQDIIESIEIIFNHVGDATEFEFNQSLLQQDAVYRRFEIIGEATTRLSDSLRPNTRKSNGGSCGPCVTSWLMSISASQPQPFTIR